MSVKEIILAVLATVAGIAAFWLWHNAMPLIIDGEFRDYANFLAPVLGLLLASILFLLTAIFVKNKWVSYGSGVLLTGIPYFFTPVNGASFLAQAISILLVAYSVYRIRKEYLLSAGFSLSRLAKAGLPVFFTVSSLIVASFFLAGIDEEKAVTSLLPRSALSFLVQKFPNILPSSINLSKISPDKTVDEFLREAVGEQLRSQGTRLSKSETNALIKTWKSEIVDKYGIAFQGDEKLSEVLYRAIVSQVRNLLGPWRDYLPITSAVVFFLAFKALTLPLYLISLLIAFVLIKMLVAVKIIKKVKTQTETEKLTL